MIKEQKTSKALNITLWVAQVILAAGFLWGSSMKLFLTVHELAEMWPWTIGNRGLVSFSAILDILIGVGLVLPTLLRILPKLTIYASYGAIALMIGASVFHISRGEASEIGINIFFGIIALFIAWGRLKKNVIMAR